MRFATQHEVPQIMAALRAMREKSPASQMKGITDIGAELGIRNLIHTGRAVIVEGYLILFDIGGDWYCLPEQAYLIELLILKVYPTDQPVSVAVKALEVLARQHGCWRIAVGDTQVGYMTPKYQAEGYQVLGTQLMKELHGGTS